VFVSLVVSLPSANTQSSARDTPIENLWSRGNDCRQFSIGHDAITGHTLVRKTLVVLKKSGVFTQAIDEWLKRPAADKTWADMQTFFNTEDGLHRQKVTAEGAGHHGTAHSTRGVEDTTLDAREDPQDVTNAANAARNDAIANRTQGATITPGGRQSLHCWSHGLGTNRDHMSQDCHTPAKGHQVNATIDDTMGGPLTMIHPRPRQGRTRNNAQVNNNA